MWYAGIKMFISDSDLGYAEYVDGMLVWLYRPNDR